MNKEWWPTLNTHKGLFTEITKEAKERVMAVMGLWRRSFLLQLLRDWENAWEFEFFGTLRAKKIDKLILCPNSLCPRIYDYHVYPKYGYGISKGKWLPQNRILFEQYGIYVDFENMGLYDYEKDMPKELNWKVIIEILSNRTSLKSALIKYLRRIKCYCALWLGL